MRIQGPFVEPLSSAWLPCEGLPGGLGDREGQRRDGVCGGLAVQLRLFGNRIGTNGCGVTKWPCGPDFWASAGFLDGPHCGCGRLTVCPGERSNI